MSREIKIGPYNFDWPSQFALEAEKIKAALGSNCVVVHHIGSTSIPGLAAKPVIDIIPVVKDIMLMYTDNLVALGYTPRGELGMPFRRFFNKGEPRTHHLHVWQEGNPEIEKHLLFRDYLIKHPLLAKEYENIKLKLASEFRFDRKNYTESKDDFIKDIIRKSGFAGLTLVQVNLANEWRSYKKITGVENPKISDNDLYFVLAKGVDIVASAHLVKIDAILQIKSIHCDLSCDIENIKPYMIDRLNKWLSW